MLATKRIAIALLFALASAGPVACTTHGTEESTDSAPAKGELSAPPGLDGLP